MLKIDIKEIKSNYDFEIVNYLADTTYKDVIKATKAELENVFKDCECEYHKEKSQGTLVIALNTKSKSFLADYNNFCCENFKNKVKTMLK